jgi:hypothetical protein
MGNFIMPAMESLAQQGYGLDANEYISVVAELSGIHELKRIITPLDGDVQERPGNPHTGDHVYTRVDSGPPRQPQTDPAGQAFSSVTDTTQNT